MADTHSGSQTGPVYCLGLIAVTTAGTPVPLSTNVPTTGAFGTASSPNPVMCNKIRVRTPSTNTGFIYLVINGGSKSVSTSVVLAVPPGTVDELALTPLNNGLSLEAFSLDADTSGNSAYVTAVMGL